MFFLQKVLIHSSLLTILSFFTTKFYPLWNTFHQLQITVSAFNFYQLLVAKWSSMLWNGTFPLHLLSLTCCISSCFWCVSCCSWHVCYFSFWLVIFKAIFRPTLWNPFRQTFSFRQYLADGLAVLPEKERQRDQRVGEKINCTWFLSFISSALWNFNLNCLKDSFPCHPIISNYIHVIQAIYLYITSFLFF